MAIISISCVELGITLASFHLNTEILIRENLATNGGIRGYIYFVAKLLPGNNSACGARAECKAIV